MNEQLNEPLINGGVSLFELIAHSGIIGATAIILSFSVLLLAPILFIVLKTKRPFIIWLMTQVIVGNLIASHLVFIMGMLNAGMSFGVTFFNDSKIVGLLIRSAIDLLGGCVCLTLIAFFLFIVKFILTFFTKLKDTKQTEPAHGLYRENAR